MSGVSGVSQTQPKNIKAVYEDEAAKNVSIDNFLQMMIAQIQNQDPLNPIDDTQYVTQLAQFATMQQMQELAYYSKTNFITSMVGKDVTAAKATLNGVQKTTGTVDKVSLVNSEYLIYVDGKSFTLSEIMEIHPSSVKDDSDSSDGVVTKYGLSLIDSTDTGATVGWDVPTEDEDADAARLRYSVYYSKSDDFDTVSKVKKGTLVGKAKQTGVTEMEIDQLTPGETYYVNVIVMDVAGNEYAYKKQSFTLAKN